MWTSIWTQQSCHLNKIQLHDIWQFTLVFCCRSFVRSCYVLPPSSSSEPPSGCPWPAPPSPGERSRLSPPSNWLRHRRTVRHYYVRHFPSCRSVSRRPHRPFGRLQPCRRRGPTGAVPLQSGGSAFAFFFRRFSVSIHSHANPPGYIRLVTAVLQTYGRRRPFTAFHNKPNGLQASQTARIASSRPVYGTTYPKRRSHPTPGRENGKVGQPVGEFFPTRTPRPVSVPCQFCVVFPCSRAPSLLARYVSVRLHRC